MDDLDSLIRRTDEDRWLASRFAPADARAKLMAIYAVNYEIARSAEVVSDAAIGDIRLAWWREALGEIHASQAPRAHPALQAYAAAMAEANLLPLWQRLIGAREKDLEAAPFAAWADLDVYLDATAGGVMRLALAACETASNTECVSAAARAWGSVGLLRAQTHWRTRGRSCLPREGGSLEQLAQRAGAALSEARSCFGQTPPRAFPALGYLALTQGYLRALKRGQTDTPLLMRQVRLVAAAATGRL